MKRYHSLDSLRGLAALSVVLWHSWPGGNGAPRWARLPVISLVAGGAGSQAVILFFVLSGFVLALPFVEGRAPKYWRFVVRRFFRLWPLFALAIAACAAWAVLLAGRPATGGGTLAGPATVLREYLPMLGPYRVDSVDGPIWSLVHEARISLVFPLMMALVVRMRRPWLLLLPLAPVALVAETWPTPLDSLTYLPEFLLGACLARDRETLAAWYSAARPARRAFLVGAALIAYSVYGVEALAAVGSAVLLIAVLAEPTVQPALRWKPIAAVGAASYSLYLLHMLVIYPADLLVHQPWLLVLLASWAIMLAGSLLAFRFVEAPLNRLGHHLTRSRLAQMRSSTSPIETRALPSEATP